MPDPLRSPKQSRATARNRSHPYARPANSHRTRDVGLSRSNSLLGVIKSFVTAPLSWLSLGDSQESSDGPLKRRVSGSERDGTPPRSKRPRHESPEAAGYLDPPRSLFPTPKLPLPVMNDINGVEPVRAMSLDISSPSTELIDAPLPLRRGHSILSHTTMSVEPQVHHPLRRSITRELSMPPPSPFARSYARSSLTPQPSGATFGPSPKRKLRESTAPPLLPSPSPKFTRPPMPSTGQQSLFPSSQSRETLESPITALLSRNRQSISPMRDSPSRSLLARDEVSANYTPSKSSAERTLSALESYRTPLHTSRFPSTTPTDNYRPRKVHVPMPSKLRFDHTPEGRREKAKRGPAVVGPYSSGMSGMRKLLARRREELETDAIIEKNTAPEQPHEVEVEKEGDDVPANTEKTKETNIEDAVPAKTHAQINGIAAKTDVQLPRTRSPPRSKPGGPYSSLRAPSNRVSRTHAPAPRPKKARNKFALDDDDDTEWSMSVEDVKNYKAQATEAQSPISFSPARSMSETGMQTDTENAPSRMKTPPLPSRPQTFDSLLSRIGSPTSTPAKPTTAFPGAPASPQKSNTETQPPDATKAETSSAPAALPFSLGTTSRPKHVDIGTSPFASNVTTPSPSPAPATTPAPPASAGDAVPSFFSNTKTQFTPPTVPAGSLFGRPPAGNKEDNAGEQSKSLFGKPSNAREREPPEMKEAQEGQKPSLGEETSKRSVFGRPSAPVFGGDNSKLASFTGIGPANTTPAASGFVTTGAGSSSEAPKMPFSGGPPAGGATVSPPSINIFGAASKQDADSTTSVIDESSKRGFPFAATSSAEKVDTHPETSTNAASSKQGFSFNPQPPASTPSAGAPKSQTSFGTPVLSPQSPNAAPEAPKSPFSFGATPSTPPPAEKKALFSFGGASNGAASAFSFGSTNVSTSAKGTAVEGPRSQFAGFGNISDPANTSVHKVTETLKAESGDGMEVNGGDRMEESPTRIADKKDTPGPLFTGFGAESSSGGFSFGQTKPAASTSGFSFGQSKPSTTTGFSFGQTADKPLTSASTGTGFNFGQGANKATASSTGFTFGNDASKPTQLSFGEPLNNPFGGGSASNPTSSTGFSFGQPNSNANASPFGQPQRAEGSTSSAPNSPSLFPQTLHSSQPQSPSFSFTVPTSNAFSAPNAAAGSSTSTTTQPFQFGASSTAQQPQQPGTSGGNTMFTLGGAATPPRKVKGLPSRRARRP